MQKKIPNKNMKNIYIFHPFELALHYIYITNYSVNALTTLWLIILYIPVLKCIYKNYALIVFPEHSSLFKVLQVNFFQHAYSRI